jgi:hypothetical protein
MTEERFLAGALVVDSKANLARCFIQRR